MRLKIKKFILFAIVISLLLISMFLNFKFIKENKFLKNFLPILPGEKISYFQLTGMNAANVGIKELNSSNVSLIFIINESCSTCSGNLPLFNKISRILSKDQVNVFGIILGEQSAMFNAAEKGNFDFKLYAPENVNRFKKELRLKPGSEYAILYHNKKVVINVPDKLDGTSYTNILRTAKKILRKK